MAQSRSPQPDAPPAEFRVVAVALPSQLRNSRRNSLTTTNGTLKVTWSMSILRQPTNEPTRTLMAPACGRLFGWRTNMPISSVTEHKTWRGG